MAPKKKNNKNIFEISDKKSPNKDCNIINVKNSKEKPTILRAKKVLLKKNNDNIIDQYKPLLMFMMFVIIIII